MLFHLTPHRGDLRTLGALPFPQVGRDTTHGSLGEGTSARKAWRWAGDVEMGWVTWRWAGPWRWVGDVEAGWGRGDAGPSQHRSSQAGASPSPETRAGPGHTHPWDTPPRSRHGRPPMGHDTRGHAAGAQGHQGHAHPSCNHSSFIGGARAAVVRRPGVSGTLAPQTPSAGVYSAVKPVSPTLPPAASIAAAACPWPPAAPSMTAAACRRPAVAPPIPAARAALVVARAAAAAPPAPSAGVAAPGAGHAGAGQMG